MKASVDRKTLTYETLLTEQVLLSYRLLFVAGGCPGEKLALAF
jgi:hypothetical protein